MSKYFGYIDQDNQVIISMFFSTWDLRRLEYLKCCKKIIMPFEALCYEDAKKRAKELIKLEVV